MEGTFNEPDGYKITHRHYTIRSILHLGLVKLHLLLVHYGLDLRVFSSDNLEEVICQHLCACNLSLFWPAWKRRQNGPGNVARKHTLYGYA